MNYTKTTALAMLTLAATFAVAQEAPALHQRSEDATTTFMAQMPTGTGLHLALDEEVASNTAKIGDTFRAHLVEPVTSAGVTLLPANTVVTGRVADVTQSGRRFRGKNTLTLRPESVTTPDGKKMEISAIMTDSYDRKALKVDEEGSVSNGAGHYARLSEIGAGVGTVAGAVVGGPVGAVAGASLGAALPAARWATKDAPVMLDSGMTFWFELTRPVHLTATAVAAAPAPVPVAKAATQPSGDQEQ